MPPSPRRPHRSIVDPASSTGTFERAIAGIGGFRSDAARDVLVFGDSRIYAGLDPALASAVIPVDSFADDTSAIGSLDADDHVADLRAIVFRVGPADVANVASSLGDDRLRRPQDARRPRDS